MLKEKKAAKIKGLMEKGDLGQGETICREENARSCEHSWSRCRRGRTEDRRLPAVPTTAPNSGLCSPPWAQGEDAFDL